MGILPLSVRTVMTVSLYAKALVPGVQSFRNPKHFGWHGRLSTRFFSSANGHPPQDEKKTRAVVSLSIPAAEDLEEIGALLGAISSPPDIIFLDGDLGAGKTTLARGFITSMMGTGAGEDSDLRITSPSYLLCNTYECADHSSQQRFQIYHLDLYRLHNRSDFATLPLDLIYEKGIALIEWASRLSTSPDLLPPSTSLLNISISHVSTSETRLVQLVAETDSSWVERLQSLVDDGVLDDLMTPNDIGP